MAKIAGVAAGAALLVAAGIAGEFCLLPSHTSSSHQQACSRSTCNDMLLSFRGFQAIA